MPEPMHGADWYHLYEESPTEPKHTLKTLVVEPGPDGFGLDEARRIAARIGRLPEGRWVAVETPGRLAPAAWVDRGPPDLDAHVDTRSLPEPTERALDVVVGECLATPLPRDRPLWRLTFVDGLADGRVALVLGVHHSLADGTASARIIEAIVDGGAAGRDGPLPVAEPVPPTTARLTHVARHHASNLADTPRLVRRSVVTGVRVMRHRRAEGTSPTMRFDCPPTRFATELTTGRSYAQAEVALERFQSAKDAHGVALNDVYLAVTGRAVHRFLADLGEEPAAALTVNVPVSVRPPADRSRHGNFMRNWTISTASDVDDPSERVARIHEETRALKTERAVFDEHLLRDWFGRYGVMRHVTRTVVDVAVRRADKTPMNFVAANVAGPRSTLWVCGSEVVGLRSSSVLIPHHALNATAWSYRDRVSMGFTSLPGVVDDLAPLARLAADELERIAG